MYATQLKKSLESDEYIRPLFQGTYSIDQLPLQVERHPSLYVVNSDLAKNVGQHWFCIYFDSDKTCNFWDSLGQHPSKYGKYLTRFLDRNCTSLLYNSRRLQSDSSAVCGHYVLYFAYYRSRKMPLECIMDHFGLCSNVNDLYVYNFCRKHFSCTL